jgi:hypothetical protein
VAACASCRPGPSSSDESSSTLQPVVVSTSSASSLEVLDGPSDRLRFLTDDLRSGPAPLLEADCAALPDGGLLVRFDSGDGDGFYGSSCVLALAPASEHRRPRAAGVFHWSDVGGWGWVPDLRGSVTVDASDPEELLCRLELADRPGMRSVFLRRSFRVVPARETESVRDDIARWANERVLPGQR